MNTSLAVLGMGGGEMVLVFAAILVLFGAKKIPEFAKGLGQGIKEFKKASREVTDEINSAANETHSSAPPAPRHPDAYPPSDAPPANPNPPATVPKT
jgi:sec-independent protein translocase protein TatA